MRTRPTSPWGVTVNLRSGIIGPTVGFDTSGVPARGGSAQKVRDITISDCTENEYNFVKATAHQSETMHVFQNEDTRVRLCTFTHGRALHPCPHDRDSKIYDIDVP